MCRLERDFLGQRESCWLGKTSRLLLLMIIKSFTSIDGNVTVHLVVKCEFLFALSLRNEKRADILEDL